MDGRVYTYGITGVLGCFNAADGTERSRIDALKEMKANNLFFGQACSPLVDDAAGLTSPPAARPPAVAFTTDKGEVAWKKIDGPG